MLLVAMMKIIVGLIFLFILIFNVVAEPASPNFWASTVKENYESEKNNNGGACVHGKCSSSKGESSSTNRAKKKIMPQLPLSFVEAYPPSMDFHERWMSTAQVQQVRIRNLSPKNTLHLKSITVIDLSFDESNNNNNSSKKDKLKERNTGMMTIADPSDEVMQGGKGVSQHFHVSLFKVREIGSMEASGMSVVFLPRVCGPIFAEFIIETNIGRLLYRVKGYGTPNPYAVQPIVGAKVPFGLSYSPSIQIYNPRPYPIKVMEVFTSGGFLHLLLPSSNKTHSSPKLPIDSVSPQSLWIIEPHSNKTIICLNFEIGSVGKYQGFVNIKIEDKELSVGSEAMILHTELTVVQDQVHIQGDEIDFGVITSESAVSSVPLYILNAGNTSVVVTDVSPRISNSMLDISIVNNIIPPRESVQVAILSLQGKDSTITSGKIVVFTNDSNSEGGTHRLEIPYSSSIVHGQIKYQLNKTIFETGELPQSNKTNVLVVNNEFSVPVALYSIEIEDNRFNASFPVFKAGIVALPGSSWPAINITFMANSSDMIHTRLHLTTNLTSFFIPLQSFNRKLTCTLPSLSFCSCPFTNHEGKLSSNGVNNSFCPSILDFGVISVGDSRNFTVSFANENPVSVNIYDIRGDANDTIVTFDSLYSNGSRELNAKLATPKSKKKKQPILTLQTGQVANFIVCAKASKENERRGEIIIQTDLPTNERVPIMYRSVEGSVSFSPATLHFDFPPSVSNTLLPISVFATSSCKKMIKILSVTTSSAMFTASLIKDVIPSSTSPLDPLISVLFDPTAATEEKVKVGSDTTGPISSTVPYSATLTISTDLLGEHVIHLSASVSLLPRVFDFGVVRIGSTSIKSLPFHNPTSSDMWIQLSLVQTPSTEWENEYEWEAHDFAIESSISSMHVPPHTTALVGPVLFTPHPTPFAAGSSKSAATLLVTNGSQVLAQAQLRGEGGAGKLLFLRGEEVQTTLLFDMGTEVCQPGTPPTTLSSWTTSQLAPSLHSSRTPLLEIVRSLEITNIGNLGVTIDHAGLNGKACNAHGFVVHNCTEHFQVEVGQRKTIFVSFYPDFSATLVRMELHLYTSQGMVVLPLVAKFGLEQLSTCNDYQSIEGSPTLRLLVLVVLCTIFAILSFLIMQEYCTNSASKIAAMNIDDNYAHQPLPMLPDLDVPPALEFIESIEKLTYDGYRPNKKNVAAGRYANSAKQTLSSQANASASSSVAVSSSSSQNPITIPIPAPVEKAQPKLAAAQESNLPLLPNFPPQAHIPFPPPSQTNYSSFSNYNHSQTPPFHSGAAILPGDSPQHGMLPLHRLSPSHFSPIQSPVFPIQPGVRPPSPFTQNFVHKPAVLRAQADTGNSGNRNGMESPPLVAPIGKAKPKRKGDKSGDPSSVYVPKPPPLPTGPLSLSAHEFSSRDKQTWNVRSQSDSALLPKTDAGPLPFSTAAAKVALQQRPRFQPRQPPSMQPMMHNLQPQLHHPQLNPQLNPIAAPVAKMPMLQLQMELKTRSARPQQTNKPTLQSPPIVSSPTTSAQPQPELAQQRQVHIQPALVQKPVIQPQLSFTSQSTAPQQQPTQARNLPTQSPEIQSHTTTTTTTTTTSNSNSSTSTATVTTTTSTSPASSTTSSPSITSNSPSTNTSSNSFAYNIAELKKRGIHRRDLVKGSTALPPNMAFVPKKRPVPPLVSPTVSPPIPQEEAISSPLSPLPRRHSSAEPDFEAVAQTQNVVALSTSNETYGAFTRRDSSDISISVGSLGGVSLRGVNTQRNTESLGVIGSGKTSQSPPTPPPIQQQQQQQQQPSPLVQTTVPSLLSLSNSLQSSAGLPPAPEMFAFLANSSTSQPSSFFAGSPRSPLHISSSSPTVQSPIICSSPLLSNSNTTTYDLFAPSPYLSPAASPNIRGLNQQAQDE